MFINGFVGTWIISVPDPVITFRSCATYRKRKQHISDSIAECRSVDPTRRGDRDNKKNHIGGYDSERDPVSAGINLM